QRTNIRAGSEKVEVLTRDRDQRAHIVRVVPLERFTDYEFDAFTGALTLRVPLPSRDDDFNPVSARVTYEIDGLGGRYTVAGANGLLHAGRRLDFTGGFVSDDNPLNGMRMGSLGSAFHLDRNTIVLGELALSNSDSLGGGGAGRVEFHHRSDRFSVN